MNNTTETIVKRLPKKDVLSMKDIADACDFATTTAIKNAITDGRLQASKIGGWYRISRDEAIRFLAESEKGSLK